MTAHHLRLKSLRVADFQGIILISTFAEEGAPGFSILETVSPARFESSTRSLQECCPAGNAFVARGSFSGAADRRGAATRKVSL
jgi:hypothetical protein